MTNMARGSGSSCKEWFLHPLGFDDFPSSTSTQKDSQPKLYKSYLFV